MIFNVMESFLDNNIFKEGCDCDCNKDDDKDDTKKKSGNKKDDDPDDKDDEKKDKDDDIDDAIDGIKMRAALALDLKRKTRLMKHIPSYWKGYLVTTAHL